MSIRFQSKARTRWALRALILTTGLSAAAAPGDPLRVGTSGDYAPFSVLTEESSGDQPFGEALQGFDVELARSFARDSGRELQFVRFRWPELTDDLTNGRFDLALSGVTVRADRTLVGRFSVPLARSGALLLVRTQDGDEPLETFDEPGVTLAVNRGGHLERVSRAHFPRASIQPIERNEDVLDALLTGRARAVVTDTLEAPHWLRREEGLVALAPFTRDDKAALIRPDRPELAREFDAWLLASERDGTLARLRAKHFGPNNQEPTALPSLALEAASAERLALMSRVAEAKRRDGTPVEDPAREQRVLASALASVERAAAERGVAPPDTEQVTLFFRDRIERAKQVQREVLARPRDPTQPEVDLVQTIRPALIRIGDRIALLLVEQAIEQRGAPPGDERPGAEADQ